MTIGGWIGCSLIAIVIWALWIVMIMCDTCASTKTKVLSFIAAVILTAADVGIFYWYFNSTAAGIRAKTDQLSNLSNGLDRTITVYTADGNILAQYHGKIDLEMDQDYVKFDWEGKRYIYYNCYIETIADIP